MNLAALAGGLSTAILMAIAAAHAAWGVGSHFPAADRDALALLVIGQRQVPPPLACFAVVAALAAIAALPPIAVGWLDLGNVARRLAGLGCWAAAAGFAARGVAGYVPAFEHVFPLEPFHTMNRIAYSPLCLVIAALLVVVAWGR